MTSFVDNLASAVLTPLHDARGLCSLQLQNHIYGCYILMQDIATSQVSHAGTTVRTDSHSFDYKKGFGEIGLRYGFLMDTKLELGTWLPPYESAWLQCFADLATSHDVEMVDKIEDAVNQVILHIIHKEEGFFQNAMEHEGTLTYEWVDKALQLLRGHTVVTCDGDEDVAPPDDALSHAHIEKPPTHDKQPLPQQSQSHRRLDTTRRNKERHEGEAVQTTPSVSRRAHLAKTRKQRHRGQDAGKN